MKTAIDFKLHQGQVAIRMGDAGDGILDWKAAREIAMELKRAIQQHVAGNLVFGFTMSGRSFFLDVELDNAKSFQKALYLMSLRAEEIAKAEQIAMDAAILCRAGAGFGMSNDPKILDMAKTEAAWNRDLRRAIPGIKSQTIVGTPTLNTESSHGPEKAVA